MRALILLLSAVPLLAGTADEKDAIATIQRTFDGMAARDAAMIRSTMLPGAKLYSVRDQADAAGTSIDDFLEHLAAVQGTLLERFTSPPQVLIHGRMAQVWGEYEFLHDGKFAHCGVDSVSLLKTADGWKIASISYTAETSGCPGH